MNARAALAVLVIGGCGGLRGALPGADGGSDAGVPVTGGGSGGASGGGAAGGGAGGGSGGGTGAGPTNCNKSVADNFKVAAPPPAEGYPFSYVASLQFDSNRNLYVLNRNSTQSWIQVFGPGPQHPFVRGLGKQSIKYGQDFALDKDGTFWVLDYKRSTDPSPTIKHLDANGNVIAAHVTGSDEGNSIALEPAGTLVIGDPWVSRFQRDGGYVNSFGQKGNVWPFFCGFANDPDGSLWATNIALNEVVHFDTALQRIGEFGGKGAGPGKFDGTRPANEKAGPSRIALDPAGNIYVNDPYGSRVMKLNRSGSMLGQYGFSGAEDIDPIAIDPLTGLVYVGRSFGVDILCPL